MKYQIITLGPQKNIKGKEVLEKIKKCFELIGLNFSECGECLDSNYNAINWAGVPVALWFGGDGPTDAQEVSIAKKFLSNKAAIFPIVESLEDYNKKIPNELQSLNGQKLCPIANATCAIRALRLSRKQRQAFISYRRSDSTGAALQLFHELTERGFKVFLDTTSVEPGVDFQETLWSRMADVDVLIFLDTKDALSSTYVYQEVNRAHDLGLGIVQLVWPGNAPSIGTELCQKISLSTEDFENKTSDKFGELTGAALSNICLTIEEERIRSLGCRRIRLMDLLSELAKGADEISIKSPFDNIDYFKDGNKVAEIVPLIGTPDAQAMHFHERNLTFPNTIIAFHGLGVDEDWMHHIEWLNNKSKAKAIAIDSLKSHVAALK